MRPGGRLVCTLLVGVPNNIVPWWAGLSHTGKLRKKCAVQHVLEFLLLTCHTVNTVKQSL